MRVCQVLESTGGGARLHVVDLLRRLPASEFELTFIYSTTRADAAFREQLPSLRESAECIEIRMVRNLDPVTDVAGIFHLAAHFRRRRFDLIHAHSGKAGLLTRIAAALAATGAKIVYTPHSSPFRLHPTYRLAERALSHWCDAVVAISESEATELRDQGIASGNRLVTINGGIDVDRHRPDPAARLAGRELLGIAADELVIGTVGRISAQKAPGTFIRMAQEVSARVPAARFVWIGDGELRAGLLDEAGRRGLGGRLTVTGFLADIHAHLNALDVFCLLSDYESLGYATLEAMATALPVVATRVAGTVDIVREGETGFLVAPKDATEAARRVMALCESGQLRRRLGDAGEVRVKEAFAVERMVGEVADLYRRLHSGRSNGPRISA